MARQELDLSQQLKQEQILAPQQIQSLEILLAPLLELQIKISQELAENPILEQEKPAAEDLAGDVLTDTTAASQEASEQEKTKASEDEELAELVRLADSWHEYLPPKHSRPAFNTEDEEKRQHFFDSLTEEPSLQELLMEQLRLSDLAPRERELTELIVGSIDDSGYLRSHLADLAIAANTDLDELKIALSIVQNFDPAGIGARDLQECLLLQLQRQGREKSPAAKLLRNHMDDIANNRLPKIAKRMGISIDKLHDLLVEIRSLNPYPGSSLSPNNPIFVIPEVSVKERQGEFVVIAHDEHLPKLRISQFYRKLLENPDTPDETKNYIKQKLTGGKMLIKSITQRQSTIKQIAEVIVDSQYDFLKQGIEHLHPMTMQQVADKLGIHETTVSRAIANKYLKTPFGLFEFKYFFTTGYQSQDGEELSSKSVMEKIRDIIAREDPAKPLSDQKLTEILREQGLPVARRTVAKYREEMDIPSSHLRREYQ